MFSWICVCDFFFFFFFFVWLKLCLQTTLLPESGKELTNQLQTRCTVRNPDRSYLSGIFSEQICVT
jgi:hypothetical protein